MTTFHVWHNGELAAGLGGDHATAEFELPSFSKTEKQEEIEYLRYVKEQLAKAFSAIWDFPAKYIHVETEEDLKDDSE